MKKSIKTAAALLSAAFLMSITACSCEAGYSSEMPVEQTHPTAWSEAESATPSVEQPDLSGPDVPSSSDEGDAMYAVGVPVSIEEFGGEDAFMLMVTFAGLVEGTDYTVSNGYVTFTASGIEKLMQFAESFGNNAQ